MIEQLEKMKKDKIMAENKKKNPQLINRRRNEPMDESQMQYLAAMKPLEGRDFKQERRNIRD